MSETEVSRRDAAAAPYRELLAALEAGGSAVLLSTYAPDGGLRNRRCILAGEGPELARLAQASGRPELELGPRSELLALAEPFFSPRVSSSWEVEHRDRIGPLRRGARFRRDGLRRSLLLRRARRFPPGTKVVCAYYRPFIDSFPVGPSTYAVICTRGHRHDAKCFRALARRGAAYLGMVGSRRRIAELKRLFLAEGFEQEEVQALRAPIGLDIGAAGPAEIALSIAAEIVAVRRRGPGAATGNSELDLEVLEELARTDGMGPHGGQIQTPGRALVTVVATRGSAPRGPGAKLIAWADGRTLGSVGGGCAEGQALLEARDRIRDGGYTLIDVDLSAFIAEEEGMACGGAMEFLVEAIPDGIDDARINRGGER